MSDKTSMVNMKPDTKEEAQEAGSSESQSAEAQAIFDSLSDKPEVCHQLYDMLKEKYEGKAKEESDEGEYNEEGMED